jgi:2-polyprenyl-3-methyl-5-hydroxy-6-metoxy-1,4-benzoquinol methylase
MNRQEWNQYAAAFETEICDITLDETNNQLSRFVNAAGLPPNPVLVDLGCGIGSFIDKFGNRFRQIIGVEYAARIIARAKERCSERAGITWLTMDISRAFEVIGTCADMVVCLNVITSPSAAKRNSLWSCLAKVTKPKGFALIVVPSLESSVMVGELEGATASSDDGLVKREDSWQKHFGRSELTATLAELGFVVRRMGRVHYPWSTEGLRKPRSDDRRPWDWICLAQRVAA